MLESIGDKQLRDCWRLGAFIYRKMDERPAVSTIPKNLPFVDAQAAPPKGITCGRKSTRMDPGFPSSGLSPRLAF